MTPTDAVLDLAEDVTDILAVLTSEIFVGLLVGFGIMIWIVAGKRDGIAPQAAADHDTQPAAQTSTHWRQY